MVLGFDLNSERMKELWKLNYSTAKANLKKLESVVSTIGIGAGLQF